MVDYMARLVGVDLPREKRLEIALTYIFGIGLTRPPEGRYAEWIASANRLARRDRDDQRHRAQRRCEGRHDHDQA